MKLHSKLLKVQQLSLHIRTDSEGQAGGSRKYRYATLAAVMDVVRPALSDAGLLLTSLIGESGVTTAIIDAESGELIESTFPVPFASLTPQQAGSAISYAKRYCIVSMLGLSPSDDDDAATATAAVKQCGIHHQNHARPVVSDGGGMAPICRCGSLMELSVKTGRYACRPCWENRKSVGGGYDRRNSDTRSTNGVTHE
jgi:hypothetical protein